ncbi:MAG TPA: NAD-dependent DNA ligase LigA [Geomonas sp.]|nr:NAD-dependent DNA ligase LigA [Geomonas sp.]
MTRPFFFWLVLVLVFPASSPAASACPKLQEPAVKARLVELEKAVRFHNELYYQHSKPVISDAEYDRLYAELVSLEGCFPKLASFNSPTRQIVGDSTQETLTLRHEPPMLSLTSSVGPDAIEALFARASAQENRITLLVQPKIDGLPVELVYHSGKLVSAATRGDGRMGAEVTRVALQIPGIPQELSGSYPVRVAVRGEIYADRGLMSKAASAKKYATPRHFAAATLKAGDPATDAIAALRLFPFELVDADSLPGLTTDSAALRALEGWGFPIRHELTRPVQTLNEVECEYRRYLAGRDRLEFAADGIVAKVDDLALRRSLGSGARAPFWAAAWKFPSETATTTVRGIRWQTGRTGRRTPVAELVPVTVAGVRVTHVSLQNAQTLQRLGVAAGDRVVIALVGDIIPQIAAVEHSKKESAGNQPDMTVPEADPTACLTDTPGCRDQFLARAAYFTSSRGLDIGGLGPGQLRRLVEAGLVKDLPSLFRLTSEEMAVVPGMGRRSAEQLAAALRRASRPEPWRLLTALGIQGIGPATARRLVGKYPSIERMLSCRQEAAERREALQKVCSFFESREGRALLKGLREAGLL